MRIKCYCDLYVSDSLKKKQNQILKNLMERKLSNSVYILTLSEGVQNHLEFFSSLLIQQHFYEEKELFIVGLAGDYMAAVDLTAEIALEVMDKTGGTDIRSYILERQKEFDESRG